MFWSSHKPVNPPWSRQYRSAIHPHDAEQERLARASLAAQEKQHGKLHTAIEREPVDAFTRAEDYHQKYRLRNHADLRKFFKELYPAERAFTDATAVARANGLLAGYGKAEDVRAALPADAREQFDALTKKGAR